MLPVHIRFFLAQGVEASGENPRLKQTHISFVLLTGQTVYKFKKPVDMGFLDFRSLENRRYYCREEVRLNQRYSSGIYRDVRAVIPTATGFRLEEEGSPGAIDYCVRMNEFPQENLLSSCAERDAMPADALEEFMGRLAALHAKSPEFPEYGSLTRIGSLVDDNIQKPLPVFGEPLVDDPAFSRVRTFVDSYLEAHREDFRRRPQSGAIRECHGDLHLDNLVLLDGRVQAFDCIEFNEAFRRIDRISEVGFLLMDLERRGYPALANRCMNTYLEASGDWEAVSVLPLYLCYRAFVRGRISALTAQDADCDESLRKQVVGVGKRCFALAADYAERFGRKGPTRRLYIMHGLSGSGKSTVAGGLARRESAVHIRSDAVRKHLAGVPLFSGAGEMPAETLYAPEMTERTYKRMNELAAIALHAGFSVVLDARYPLVAQRGAAMTVAEAYDAKEEIVFCEVPLNELRRRLSARRDRGGDVSDATVDVLESQVQEQEPFTAAEWSCVHVVRDDDE